MATSHNLGFPRIGAQRQLKQALEAFWAGQLSEQDLQEKAQQLRLQHWQWQQEAGLDLLPVGDFALYDHMLQLCQTFGVVPERFQQESGLNQLFAMARGASSCCGQNSNALEMTKWFDTNYHYLVPEFENNQNFELAHSPLLEQLKEAEDAGFKSKPVLVGPLTFLWLGKTQSDQNKLDLLPALIEAYIALLQQIEAFNCEWVQLDEPILSLDLPAHWLEALRQAYQKLTASFNGKILVANYFGSLADKLDALISANVEGLHIDAVRDSKSLNDIAIRWPAERVLSVGIVDGRNIWRTDLNLALNQLKPIAQQRGEKLWVAPSCSLLHVPVDADLETELDSELKGWLAFAKQKLSEVVALTHALNGCQSFTDRALFTDSEEVQRQRRYSSRVLNLSVRQRAHSVLPEHHERSKPFTERHTIQQITLGLPPLPSTTIGSFPQTPAIRQHRAAFKRGELSSNEYQDFIEQEITAVIKEQEDLGLDVLVHGEPERNDMVEFFGEHLAGVAVTKLGWVQSYGSRCVKPPLIYGDVERTCDLTLKETLFAQSLTSKPVKGMLTGPVTLLNWSFVRADLPRSEVAQQLALAVRDEVLALEQAGITIIQIDEPALREGLPLREADKETYLKWAVDAFRLSANGVADSTQIHTHMCYCEFDDIIDSIQALDADVISIEASRSGNELLKTFTQVAYHNAIGLGLYDIHSPYVPDVNVMGEALQQAATLFDTHQLWVNPDCGLKTRRWPETKAALANMVTAAQSVREELIN